MSILDHLEDFEYRRREVLRLRQAQRYCLLSPTDDDEHDLISTELATAISRMIAAAKRAGVFVG